MPPEPSVSIVIPNWNGAAHLRPCLDSVGSLDYPRDRLEVVVVDNGSSDDSVALIRREYPDVRVLELSENLGFAEACNAGARAACSDCVAFLNNDMRVDRKWARALVDCYDPAAGYVCVAGVILDWEGERVDFVSGWATFVGNAGQDHYGELHSEELIADRRDLLFSCGGSMLIAREVFLELGGFDPSYFAFFEDVDLGWRLWLAGYRVRLAGTARSFHRQHGSSTGVPAFRRTLLYERNALFTLIKNVGDENLPRLLTCALFLLVKRAQVFSESDREAFSFGSGDTAKEEVVKRTALARLHAAADVVDELPQLLERRRVVQNRRERSDEEIFALFSRPFVPLSHDDAYLEASLMLRAAFGVDRLFTRQRAKRALVVLDGTSNRLAEVADVLRPFLDVLTISPGSGEAVLEELLAESDLVVVSAAAPHSQMLAERTQGLLVVDVGERERDLDPALRRRADLLLSVDLRDDATRLVFRELAEEPWRWRRRDGEVKVDIPEDLQQLLRRWRTRYRRPGLLRRAVTALPLPKSLEASIRRLLGRSRVAAR